MPRLPFRSLAWLACVLLSCAMSPAWAVDPQTRAAILDTVRPKAAKEAGQPVKIKVDRLNVDGGWAILSGELVGAGGKAVDWRRAKDCDPNLDKGLWAVLRQRGGAWRIEELFICTSEPRYWYLEQDVGLIWPCGVYAGMQTSENETLEQVCRRQQAAQTKKEKS